MSNPKYTNYDRDGFHFIVEEGRDNRGNYVSVYYCNLLGQPVLTKSQKHGLVIPSVYRGLVVAAAMELADFHFGNVVTFG